MADDRGEPLGEGGTGDAGAGGQFLDGPGVFGALVDVVQRGGDGRVGQGGGPAGRGVAGLLVDPDPQDVHQQHVDQWGEDRLGADARPPQFVADQVDGGTERGVAPDPGGQVDHRRQVGQERMGADAVEAVADAEHLRGGAGAGDVQLGDEGAVVARGAEVDQRAAGPVRQHMPVSRGGEQHVTDVEGDRRALRGNQAARALEHDVAAGRVAGREPHPPGLPAPGAPCIRPPRAHGGEYVAEYVHVVTVPSPMRRSDKKYGQKDIQRPTPDPYGGSNRCTTHRFRRSACAFPAPPTVRLAHHDGRRPA